MRRLSTWLAIVSLALALLPATPTPVANASTASVSAAAAPSARYFFHGTPSDQANKARVLTDPSFRGTATFDTSAPTGAVPITQEMGQTFLVDQNSVGNPGAAYWRGAYTGTENRLLQLKWSWSSPNALATLVNGTIEVTVFADPDYVANRDQPQHVIGHARLALPGVNPAPKQYTHLVPVSGTINGELMIQVIAVFIDTGNSLVVSYDSTTTASEFQFVDPLPVATPSVAFDTSTPVSFAPSTVVSAHFLGAEPQVTMERRIPASLPGRVDPKRIFVDWPLSSRSQIGQLSRSTNGGDSFRLLLDLTCAARSRPNCMTGGGGDTEETVNLANGNLFFSDQEVLANVSESSSTDHGDTFPVTRQFAITNVALVTDRHWLAATDGVDVTVAGRKIEAFLTYHGGPVTTVGQYVQGIDQDGLPLPQPAVGQIRNVSQSGPVRFDATSGPGRGWIYQVFYNSTGIKVATAFGPTYIDPNSWVTNDVDSTTPLLIPWLQLDNAGNAYVSWSGSGDGITYLAMSPIADARNNPSLGGRPGTYWTGKVRVTPAGIKSSVFPAVVGGDAGRIAIAYVGSEDCSVGAGQTFIPDNCVNATRWNTYISVIPNALNLLSASPATIFTGVVSHRAGHRGNVCTGGTIACLTAGDRSLLDLLDLGFDEDGRVGVVFMDNNNRLAAPNLTDTQKNGPFALFAKQVGGPSLNASRPTVAVAVPDGAVTSPPGDATWPNAAAGKNLPSFDLLGAQAFIDADGQLVARLVLADSSTQGIKRDLAQFNATPGTQSPATRAQYVFRFATADEVYHLSFEQNADGTGRFFGGRLDANDQLLGVGSTAVFGAAYHADPAYAVSGSTHGNAITLRAKASDFGLAVGSRLVSGTGFAMAGQAESTELTIANVMRTIDATPPFDTTLGLGQEPKILVDCTDPTIRSGGGWHTLSDPRAGQGTLCRNIAGQSRQAFMQLSFTGRAIDLIAAKGPRGGTMNVSLDGGSPARIDLYRAPNGTPDMSGRKDLDFGVTYSFTTSGAGTHTLRIDVTNESAITGRDMIYVDGFAITAGDVTPPPPGLTSDISTPLGGTLVPLVVNTSALITDAATAAIEVVVESVPGTSVTLRDPLGLVVATIDVGEDGVQTVESPAGAIGTYTVELGAPFDAAFMTWRVLTERR